MRNCVVILARPSGRAGSKLQMIAPVKEFTSRRRTRRLYYRLAIVAGKATPWRLRVSGNETSGRSFHGREDSNCATDSVTEFAAGTKIDCPGLRRDAKGCGLAGEATARALTLQVQAHFIPWPCVRSSMIPQES